jgi:hypothetical protein
MVNRLLTGYLTVNILYFSYLKPNTNLEGGDQRRLGRQTKNVKQKNGSFHFSVLHFAWLVLSGRNDD